MPTEKDLYRVLKDWIEAAAKGEKCDAFRTDFGTLEREVFGTPAERVRNPKALKYDVIRNALVMYSGKEKDRADLAEAQVLFVKIPTP